MQMTDAQRRTFEFRECLGRGGFGEVYLAKMTVPSGLSSSVAVKVLHAGLDPRSQGVRRLMDEGKILSMLNHPCILGVHDLAIIEGRVALITEFIEGADLGDCMQGEDPIPTGALFEAFAGVADALHAAHNATDAEGNPLGLLHRDVKPGNIRVGKHGQVKLLDFGIATATGMDREAHTGTNALIGSFAYMPPERFRRVPMEPAGDFYSLGCALFECLTGDRLFHLDDMAALLGPKTDPKTAKEFYQQRFELLSGPGEVAKDLILKTVAVRVEGRPTGPEIVAALEDLAADVGGQRLARWARAHDWADSPSTESGSLTGQVVVETASAAPPRQESSRPRPSSSLSAASTVDVEVADAAEIVDEVVDEVEDTDEIVASRRSPLLLLLPLGLLVGGVALALGIGGAIFAVNWGGRVDDPVVVGPVPPDPGPKPVGPKLVAPEPAEPVEPQPVGPEPVGPKPVGPKPVDPEPAVPGPAGPKPADPQPVRPGPVMPDPAMPDPSATVEPDGTGVDRCGSLAVLEGAAATGTLGGSAACLSRGMRDKGTLSQTEREKMGRIVLVDALARCKKGDCKDYEREQVVFFEDVTRSDAQMMFSWASHLAATSRHADARLWANRALERKSQWRNATYVKRVDALMALLARSSYALWKASPRDDALRNQAREDASEWANNRGRIGKSTKEAMDMCISAAGSAEVCNARVNDAVAKGKVVFVSVPPSMKLKIDGKERGTTPLELELGFGTHQVELVGSGSSAHTVEVGTSQPKRWTWKAEDSRWTSAF